MTDNRLDTALRQAAACAREKFPGQEKRLERGLLLALNGHVTLNTRYLNDDTAAVRSDRDPEVVYHIQHGHCECPDWSNAPDGNCKHRFAAWLVRLAQAALNR